MFRQLNLDKTNLNQNVMNWKSDRKNQFINLEFIDDEEDNMVDLAEPSEDDQIVSNDPNYNCDDKNFNEYCNLNLDRLQFCLNDDLYENGNLDTCVFYLNIGKFKLIGPFMYQNKAGNKCCYFKNKVFIILIFI